MRNEVSYTAMVITFVICFVIGFAAAACQGQELVYPPTPETSEITVRVEPLEEVELSAEAIRTAQERILNRILNEADNGNPTELLKLSQTLATLQAAEGQQDALMVARAVEPQLEHLPEMVQTIQQGIVSTQVGAMLEEFRHRDEEFLPMMRGIIQVWGESLDMGAKVQQDIRDADELAEAEQAMADLQADEDARNIASTYEWKYVGSEDSSQVYQIVRKDGLAMDAKRDRRVLTYFDQSSWTDVEGQYMIDGTAAESLNKAGVLLSFSPWSWEDAEPKFRQLERVSGPRRAQLISK